MEAANYILCMDIGGTHITVALLNKSVMQVVGDAYLTAHVDSSADKHTILNQWSAAIVEVLQRAQQQPTQVLVAMPGPFDYEAGICLMDGMHKYQSLLYMDVRAYLAELLELRPKDIKFFNDAQAFLRGEVYYHQLQDKRVVGLSLGTGLGSAYYEQGSCRDLNYGSAAFREGIAEDYISTRGVVKMIKEEFSLDYPGVREVLAAGQPQEIQQAAIRFLQDNLTDFIAQYIFDLQPDIIILGGSIAKAHALFLADLQSRCAVEIRVASFDTRNLFYGITAALDNL